MTSGRVAVSARIPSMSAARPALAAQKSNRASAASVSRSGDRVGRDERRQLVEDPVDLLLGRDLGLAPGVAELDGDERLDEQRRAAARRVVDDALDLRPGLGLDRDDVAAVAEGDDRVLERAAELRADERVEPAAEPVVGDPDGRPQPAEPGRGGVEQLAGRIEAPGEGRADRRQRRGARGRARGGAAGGRRRATSGGGRSRRGCRRSRGTGPDRAGRRGPPARRPARCRAPRRSRRRAAPRAGSGSGRSRRGRVRRGPGRSPGWSVSARRRDGGNDVFSASRSRTSGNSRRAIERASIAAQRPAGAPGSVGRDTDGLPAIANRHGRVDPRRRRRSRSRPAARSTTSGRRVARRRRLDPDGGDRVEQVAAGQRPVEVERRADEARDRRRDARRGSARRATAARRPIVAGRACVGATAARRIGAARIASAPSIGSTARTSSAAGVAGGLGDDVQTVVHAVDKVHVGPARRPVHDLVPGGPPEPGVRRPVVLADVRLELDDPAATGRLPSGSSRIRRQPRSAGRPRASAARAARPRSRPGRRRPPWVGRSGTDGDVELLEVGRDQQPEDGDEARDQARPEQVGESPRCSSVSKKLADPARTRCRSSGSSGSGRTSRG